MYSPEKPSTYKDNGPQKSHLCNIWQERFTGGITHSSGCPPCLQVEETLMGVNVLFTNQFSKGLQYFVTQFQGLFNLFCFPPHPGAHDCVHFVILDLLLGTEFSSPKSLNFFLKTIHAPSPESCSNKLESPSIMSSETAKARDTEPWISQSISADRRISFRGVQISCLCFLLQLNMEHFQ